MPVPAAADIFLSDVVQPKWWFSAHLHVKFHATLNHNNDQKSSEPDDVAQLVPSQIKATKAPEQSQELSNSQNDDESTPQDPKPAETTTNFHGLESSDRCNGPDLTDQMTQFLALDKCLPRRKYLSILHVESAIGGTGCGLEYDAEWLAVLRKTHGLMQRGRTPVSVPDSLEEPTESEVGWIKERLLQQDGPSIPQNFEQTVPYHSDPVFRNRTQPLPAMGNPQTDALLNLLDLEHILTIPHDKSLSLGDISMHLGGRQRVVHNTVDSNEIDIDDLEEEGTPTRGPPGVSITDENEIEIESDDDDPGMDTGPATNSQKKQPEESETPMKKARVESE